MYDVLIRNGTIIDGTGGPPYAADVAVADGKIAAIGRCPCPARLVIDAAGKAVTPGFIDIHRHADAEVFREGFGTLELRQGLTTIVNGNCGLSAASIDGPCRQAVLDYLAPITGPVKDCVPTGSLEAYLRAADHRPLHTGMLAGAGTIRAAAAGYACQALDQGQIRTIQRELERALAEGALGVSLGLGYAPECFYTTEELIAVLSVLRGTDLPVTVHMREEGDGVCEALAEMLTVARRLRVPVHISHLKAMGRRNWGGKIPRAVAMLDRARADGLDVTCDVYPYTAGSTQLIHILPPDFLTGGTRAITERLRDPARRRELAERIQSGRDFDNSAGRVGWENILCATLGRPENRPFQGMSVADIARAQGKDPFTCACDLLVSEECAVTMIDFITDEADIARILRLPYSAVISDSTYPTAGKRHPRVYGAFPRILEKYVRQEGILTLPEAVASMTAIPADALRLRGKGRLAAGMDADINIFDPAAVREAGTYADPHRCAEGMDWVLVGGEAAIAAGVLTGARAGRSIRRQRSAASD